MSADLFAAFGLPGSTGREVQEEKQASTVPASASLPDQSVGARVGVGVVGEEDEEDGWGDFQAAQDQAHDPIDHAADIRTTGADDDLFGLSTVHVTSAPVHDVGESGGTSRYTAPHPEPVTFVEQVSQGVEVLFDATDAKDEEVDDAHDDYGDFESGSPAKAQTQTVILPPAPLPAPTSASVDLLGITPVSSPYPQPPKSPSFRERNPFGDLSVATKADTPTKTQRPNDGGDSATPVTAWPSFPSAKPDAAQEEWTDFLDSPFSVTPGGSGVRSSAASEWTQSVPTGTDMPLRLPSRRGTPALPNRPRPVRRSESRPSAAQRPSALSIPLTTDAAVCRPSNIPPPSILLLLFPPLFKRPLSTAVASIKAVSASSLPSQCAPTSCALDLDGHVLAGTTAARIIAGRKHRWKRDPILAQATKIGPAASSSGGRGAGMKLTSVDKAETAREEREVAEVVAAWKLHVGRLRSALASASTAISTGSNGLSPSNRTKTAQALPDLQATIPITVATVGSGGGISAAHACALCGLKRDERVAKVDHAVEDSLGEWWADYWGHVACRAFWERWRGELPQR
ncbi:MAG: hypothetical protein M1838_006128 [Thelocarpon superellum]|nr:MAG: hypothetical protein M1838_006128 [Thelocarpon superellum]